MNNADVVRTMHDEWNGRAKEDANYYVAFGRRNQAEEEFFASAADVVRLLETELRRSSPGDWAKERALEIGCGPGRLMRFLSRHFGEVHGVDISDEMIRRAKLNLNGFENTSVHHTQTSDLSAFADESFAFVYSYAVFQHIPSRQVIWNYLRDALRVLKSGGLLVFQINGLPETGHEATTWNGVRYSAEEMAGFARETGVKLLVLNNRDTQYMWVTLQKRSDAPPAKSALNEEVEIQTIGNAHTGEQVLPAGSRFGAASIWVRGLPGDADLLTLTARIDGVLAQGCYLGPPTNGLRQFNVLLPKQTRTGFVPLQLEWLGRTIATAWARTVPRGPLVPRIVALTDGTNLSCHSLIETGYGKLVMEEVFHPELVRIWIDGSESPEIGAFCVDPLHDLYEFNFAVPPGIAAGSHAIHVSIGTRSFAPLPLEIVQA